MRFASTLVVFGNLIVQRSESGLFCECGRPWQHVTVSLSYHDSDHNIITGPCRQASLEILQGAVHIHVLFCTPISHF